MVKGSGSVGKDRITFGRCPGSVSLCLCASVVIELLARTTTETQRHRETDMHREEFRMEHSVFPAWKLNRRKFGIRIVSVFVRLPTSNHMVEWG